KHRDGETGEADGPDYIAAVEQRTLRGIGGRLTLLRVDDRKCNRCRQKRNQECRTKAELHEYLEVVLLHRSNDGAAAHYEPMTRGCAGSPPLRVFTLDYRPGPTANGERDGNKE